MSQAKFHQSSGNGEREKHRERNDSVADDGQSTHELVERCLTGEERAWERLYARFQPRLLRAIEFLLHTRNGRDGNGNGNTELVEEIASRVWYGLLRNDCQLLAKYDVTRQSPLEVFLMGLARIEILRFMRSERRRLSHELKGGKKKLKEQRVSEFQVATMMKEFMSTLSKTEKEFVKDYLTAPVDSINDSDFGNLSRTNIWQRRHRIRSKLNRFFDQ